MNKLFPVAAIAAAYVALSIGVHAEEVPPNTIIVTATRTAQTVDETLASVTVITREDIENSQAKNAVDLLNGVSGLKFTALGGPGKSSDLFLRGTNKDHVVVLVDGVRIGSATGGDTAWQHLPVQQIERIEIVRGPQSSLYGADAIGGVIQIFTRKGKAGFHAGANAGYGTHDSREYAANVGGAQGGFHYSAAAAYFKTDGINARTVTGSTFDPDLDGYFNKSFSSRLGYRFDGGTEIAANVINAHGHTDFDATTTSGANQTDFEQGAVGAEFRVAPTNKWEMKLQAGRSVDENENFRNATFSSRIETKRRNASWQNDITLASRQLLTLGVDRQKDIVNSTNATGVNQINPNSRDNVGYFAQHQAGVGDHDLLLGLRHDDNDAFGVNDTGNLSWGYALDGERLRLITSYGTAFKAPTFNQLYFPGFGNKELKPEESESFELGLRGKQDTGRWSVRAYQTNVDNLIVNVGSPLTPQNVNRARIRGLETEASMQAERARVVFNVTILDPRDVQSDKLLPRRSKQSARFDAEYEIESWRLGGEWLVQSYSYDNATNTIRLGGYGLVNLRAQYDFAKHWFLRASANNLFDKEYQTAATFNTLGRNYFATIGYQTK